jgi:hypothetical protein
VQVEAAQGNGRRSEERREAGAQIGIEVEEQLL